MLILPFSGLAESSHITKEANAQNDPNLYFGLCIGLGLGAFVIFVTRVKIQKLFEQFLERLPAKFNNKNTLFIICFTVLFEGFALGVYPGGAQALLLAL